MSSALPSQPAAPAIPAERPRPPFNEVSALFPLLTIYTCAYMALMLADFLLRDVFSLPEGLLPVYIALLGAYAADKEIRRWLGASEPPRKGSLFVYLWLIFFLSAFILSSLQPQYLLPNNLITVCLQVLGIFFGSRTSKYVWEGWNHASDKQAGAAQAEELLALIQAQGRLSKHEVAQKLKLSNSAAKRLLANLTARGHIQLIGAGRGAYYICSSTPDQLAIDNPEKPNPFK